MRYTFLNPLSKITFTFLILALFSVQVSAQGGFSAGSVAVKKSPSDTVKIVNSDGTVSYKIIEKKVTKPPVVAQDTILRENADGTFDMILVDKSSKYDCADNSVYEFADEMPEFIGGQTALYKYISENIKYPEFESKNKIEGKVVVKFTVDKFGLIKDVKAVRAPAKGEALAKEAVRVVANMPKWKAGKKNNLLVNVSFTLPIDFKIK